jgi:hypothetical protein
MTREKARELEKGRADASERLMEAAKGGDVDGAREAIKARAKVNARTMRLKNTPLHWALITAT